ncbi:OadG family transporter subunit [Marinimicrobium sp. ABcell2]|uniref:OadG family transporter subunit n=1 Tax=Marinimicrobium sp. ABcell2 TaxID=3069751 RepID=UPI0027AE97B1|nr:OadG family transporter subunit [Marinimicrobium sp. ABcell2]MDQ2078500.1 OadG family transporter subunit [Marinimicrobium sp. ABcell2]
MDSNLLQEGLDLLLYGMGSVLVFLTLLVVATLIMSAVMRRFFQDPEVPEITGEGLETSPQPAVPDQRLLTVIKTALELHRDQRKK